MSWPKKMSVRQYADRWYVNGSRTTKSIINDIKAGRLPGDQEASGAWYVWVLADGSPARPAAQKNPKTGNDIADSILRRRRA